MLNYGTVASTSQVCMMAKFYENTWVGSKIIKRGCHMDVMMPQASSWSGNIIQQYMSPNMFPFVD